MPNRSIQPESCYISPVCIDRAHSSYLTVHSLKLAARGDLRAAGRVLVVLVADDQVVHEATFDVTPHARAPLLRVEVPSHLLARHCTGGLVTGLVVLEDKDGRISDIVDSGQVLVFPKDAAQEVRCLFDMVIEDTKQFFGQQEPMLPMAHAQQAETMLSRAAKSIHAMVATNSSAAAAAAGASGPGNASQRRSTSASHSSSSVSSGVVDAVTLYAYEHFMLPFVRHWAALLKRPTTPLQPGCSSLDAAKADTLAIRLLHFMLDNEMWACSVLLLDKFPSLAAMVQEAGLELPGDFCDLVVLERLRAALPAVRGVQQQLLLGGRYEVLPGHQQQGAASAAAAGAAGPFSSQQQQQQQGLQVLHELHARSSYSIMSSRELCPSPASDVSSNESWSVESASEILRQLSALQQARAEQHEALEGYLQPPSSQMRSSRAASTAAAAAAAQGLVTASLQDKHTNSVFEAELQVAAKAVADTLAAPTAGKEMETAAGEAWAAARAGEEIEVAAGTAGTATSGAQRVAGTSAPPAAAAAAAAVPAAAAAASAATSLGTLSGAAAHDECSSDKVSAVASRPAAATLMDQAGDLTRVALSGFPDQCIEQSYLVFKNHTNLSLDATAGIICGGMLVATVTRSVDIVNDPEAWGKVAVLMAYGVFFFFPYILMHYNCRQFLRFRETLLVVARCVTAVILIFVGTGLVSQPDAWLAAVQKTMSLQLQNGFILPSCQQLRVRAVGAIAAVHWASDAIMLGLGQPMSSAILQSSLIQMCALVVALAWDVWCRHRFVQRYIGVLGGSVGGLVVPAGRARAGTAAAAAGTSSNKCGTAATMPIGSIH